VRRSSAPATAAARLAFTTLVASTAAVAFDAPGAFAAVALAGSTQESARPIIAVNVTTLTVAPGPDRLLLVGVEIGDDTVTATRVAWDGVPLVRIGHRSTAGSCTTELWELVAPAPGNNLLELVLSQPAAFGIGAAAYSGVDQTSPHGPLVENAGADSMAAVVVIAGITNNQPIFGAACLGGSWGGQGGGAPAAVVAAGQTSLWDFTEQGVVGLGTHRLDGSDTLRWNIQSGTRFGWFAMGLRINAAGSMPAPDASDGSDGRTSDSAALPDRPTSDGRPAAERPDAAAVPPDSLPPDDGATLDAPAPPDDAEGSDSAGDASGGAGGSPPDAEGVPIGDVHLKVGCACQLGSPAAGSVMPLLVALLWLRCRCRPRRR
jgi:hypothetical protein